MAFPINSNVAGIVLCGGQSRRMGRPKAWLPFGPETLLARVARILGEATYPVVVVAAPGQNLPSLPGSVKIVRDQVEGQGPLEGIAAGLRQLQGSAELAYVTSCDAPWLTAAWIDRMVGLIGSHAVSLPHIGGFHQPLSAVYRVSVLPAIERLLADGKRRPLDLFQQVPTRLVTLEDVADIDPTLRALRNLNTPEEYDAALREGGYAV